MMKQEFEDMIQSELSLENWQIIETVYMWHPRFEIDGKAKAAELWKSFGTSIFREMYAIALQGATLRQQVQSLLSQLNDAKRDLQEFSNEWK